VLSGKPLEKTTTVEKTTEKTGVLSGKPLEKSTTAETTPATTEKVVEKESLKQEEKSEKSEKDLRSKQYRLSTGRLNEGGGVAELQKKFMTFNKQEN